MELTGLQVNTKRNRKTTEKKSIVTQVQIPLARQEVPGSVGRRPGSCAWVGGTEKRKKKTWWWGRRRRVDSSRISSRHQDLTA